MVPISSDAAALVEEPALGDRQYTPEDIRHIGDTSLPAIAASYDELKSLVAGAKSAAGDAFANASIQPQSAAEQFNTLWGRFVTVVEESPETLGDMGQTFVEIADRYVDDEAQVVLDLDAAFSDLEEIYVNQSDDSGE